MENCVYEANGSMTCQEDFDEFDENFGDCREYGCPIGNSCKTSGECANGLSCVRQTCVRNDPFDPSYQNRRYRKGSYCRRDWECHENETCDKERELCERKVLIKELKIVGRLNRRSKDRTIVTIIVDNFNAYDNATFRSTFKNECDREEMSRGYFRPCVLTPKMREYLIPLENQVSRSLVRGDDILIIFNQMTGEFRYVRE